MMYVVEDRLLYAGDLIFAGRIPFVGNGDSRGWLAAMDKMLALRPRRWSFPVMARCRATSRATSTLTRDYLVFLRETMGRAVTDLEPFDEAYAKTDWSRFSAAARVRAGQPHQRLRTYLRMEQEELTARQAVDRRRSVHDRVGFNRGAARQRHPWPHAERAFATHRRQQRSPAERHASRCRSS